ncbi:hypothetical protein HK105_202480 [Polyrhizophydium stewartii]|uniref:Uncharacterized protein n=1 Tax=Polyrhizophydium stewartii TaxID=2732419 RepID=A0ABR4NEW7_9FUNG
MGLLPLELLSQPLNIACLGASSATAAANLFVAGLIASQLLRGRNAAWRMFAFLAILNIVSVVAQVLVAYRIYFELGTSPLSFALRNSFIGFLFLGFSFVQLEFRFVFGVLFASRPEDVWTPSAKTRARIAVAIAHFTLAWGQYVPQSVFLMANTTSAYLITSALLRTSKRISPDDTTQVRHRLIWFLCFSIAVESAGIAAYICESVLGANPRPEWANLVQMLFQISVASLGCEAVFQSLSLMIMTDLVAGKVAPISAKANLLRHIWNAVKKRSMLQQAEDSELARPSSVTKCPDKATPSATMAGPSPTLVAQMDD